MKLRPSLFVFVAACITLPAVANTSESVCVKNVQITEHKFGATDQRTGEALFALGNFYHAHQQETKADGAYAKAMSAFAKHPGSNGDLLRFYDDQLARVYLERGDLPAAEVRFKQSIAIGEKIPGQGKTYVLPNTLLGLSQVYVAEHKYENAEQALKRRLELRHRFMNMGQVDPALADLTQLYIAWGRMEEAKKTLDELATISPVPPAVKSAYANYVAHSASNAAATP